MSQIARYDIIHFKVSIKIEKRVWWKLYIKNSNFSDIENIWCFQCHLVDFAFPDPENQLGQRGAAAEESWDQRPNPLWLHGPTAPRDPGPGPRTALCPGGAKPQRGADQDGSAHGGVPRRPHAGQDDSCFREVSSSITDFFGYTLSVKKKLITSSEWHSLKSIASKFIIFRHK